jgi:hypothetical protein
LKEVFPNKTFDEALATIVKIDRDAYNDPLLTAATVAASFNMPVLPHQHAAQAERDQAVAVVQHGVRTLPGLAQTEMRQAVANILDHPQFVKSGNMQYDLQRAHAVHQHLSVQDRQISAWAEAELAKMPADLSGAIQHVILHDEQFKAQAARNVAARPFGDASVAQQNFELARGMALQKSRALSKARRALPVKSSSGAKPQTGSGMDRHIKAALHNSGWE